MILSSGMTDAECVRLNGTLPIDRIEALLTAVEENQKFVDHVQDFSFTHCVNKAIEAYPAKGFANEVLDELRDLLKWVRGQNRECVTDLITKVEALQTDVLEEADKGIGELHELTEHMEKA